MENDNKQNKVSIKIKKPTHKISSIGTIGVIFVFLFAMLYNFCLVSIMCYLAYMKNWWATLLLIPFCMSSPSFKSSNGNIEEEDENGE